MYIILFVIGITLVILNGLAIKKETHSFGNTFKLAEAEFNESDIKIGKIRREFAETITELQREIIDLREVVENLRQSPSNFNKNENYERKREVDIILKNNIMNEIREFYDNNAKNVEISYNKHMLQEQNENKLTDINHDHKHVENSVMGAYQVNENANLDLDNSLMQEESNSEKGKTTLSKSNNFKIEDVRNLFNEGLNIEEIATQLNIGKGEVLLIKELYLR